VVVADDDARLSEGWRACLSAWVDVVGEVGNGTEALALVRTGESRHAVIDIRSRQANTEGLDVARVSGKSARETGILVLFGHVEVDSDGASASGRAIGYLSKVVNEPRWRSLSISLNGSPWWLVIDPALIQEELVSGRQRPDPPLCSQSSEPRGLGAVAEGRSNAGWPISWAHEAPREAVWKAFGKRNLPRPPDDQPPRSSGDHFFESR